MREGSDHAVDASRLDIIGEAHSRDEIRLRIEAFGQAEVTDLGDKIRNPKSEIRIRPAFFLFKSGASNFGFSLQEDVRRLEVAVNEAAFVDKVHGPSQCLDQVGGLRQG